jgi:hypothetical protein
MNFDIFILIVVIGCVMWVMLRLAGFFWGFVLFVSIVAIVVSSPGVAHGI